MDTQSKTAIIIPCYNESQRLQPARFQEAVTTHPDTHFFFVNDGSRDGTLGALRDMCQPYPGTMHIVNLPRNQGKAEAVRQGVLSAMHMEYNYVGYWDADLATPLDAIPEFIQALDQHPPCLMVMGSRVKLLGRDIQRQPVRHYLGRIFATCASAVLKLPVYDTQCGAKLFRNNDTMKQAFTEPFRVGWIFDVELIGRITLLEEQKGNNDFESLLVEFPLEQWIDIPGSKIKPTDFAKSGVEMLKIAHYLHHSRKKK